jgi:hypothetical protein
MAFGSLKRQQVLTQRHDITSQKTRILNKTGVRAETSHKMSVWGEINIKKKHFVAILFFQLF